MFKVGDVVKRKENMWKDIVALTLQPFDKFEVTAYFNDCKFPLVCFRESGSYQWDAAYFELVVEDKPKRYSIGDKVISTRDTPSIPEGFVGYVVDKPSNSCNDYEYAVENLGQIEYFNEDELELLSAKYPYNQVGTPDIARPILEERKVGKIRMELFDSGFPNAILEIAKVMTWANTHKGYKDNDWKVLPDAENAFKGAAARHRVKLDAQRSLGEDLLNCVDEESGITHLAHECFNNLALLELALMGKIK